MAYQITNPALMDEDERSIAICDATAAAPSLSQLPACVFLPFDPTIDRTTVYGECLEAQFAHKSGVAVPDIVRTNPVGPPMTNVHKLLKVKDLLVANQDFTGANQIAGTIKPPKAGSMWLECLPEGWTAQVQKYYLRCIFAILSKRIQELFRGRCPQQSLILIQIWVALRTIWKHFCRKAAATPTYHHGVKTGWGIFWILWSISSLSP
jgi:hypothetical protein